MPELLQNICKFLELSFNNFKYSIYVLFSFFCAKLLFHNLYSFMQFFHFPPEILRAMQISALFHYFLYRNCYIFAGFRFFGQVSHNFSLME
jgi:hypothetical protein